MKTLKKPKLDPHTELLRVITQALIDAQEHLDYCHYGDPWEQECAEAQGLSQKIADAVEAGRLELNKHGVTL
jgi:hypothetical protein